jgi:FMNH2-dependent dimethyl sulfone monooxygenase
MNYGIWTPVPHAIRSEPRMAAAVATIQQRGEGAGRDCGFDFAVEVLQTAERLGFDRTLVAQRYLGPDLEAWVLATALAMQTEAMQMIIAVHPGIVSPQLVAKMGATLDRISGGRAAINLVNGWWEEEYNMFGNGAWLARTEARYQRMDEFLEVLISLWSENGADVAGEYFSIQNSRMPSTPLSSPYPPIYTASMSEAGKDSAAKAGDYWVVTPKSSKVTHRDFAQVSQEMRDETAAMLDRAAKLGRSIEVGITGHVICADTQEEAERRADELLAYGKQGTLNMIVARGVGPGLVGSPEVVAERLSIYEEMGVTFNLLHFHPMIDGLQYFAERVMPLVGAGWRAA